MANIDERKISLCDVPISGYKYPEYWNSNGVCVWMCVSARASGAFKRLPSTNEKFPVIFLGSQWNRWDFRNSRNSCIVW